MSGLSQDFYDMDVVMYLHDIATEGADDIFRDYWNAKHSDHVMDKVRIQAMRKNFDEMVDKQVKDMILCFRWAGVEADKAARAIHIMGAMHSLNEHDSEGGDGEG